MFVYPFVYDKILSYHLWGRTCDAFERFQKNSREQGPDDIHYLIVIYVEDQTFIIIIRQMAPQIFLQNSLSTDVPTNLGTGLAGWISKVSKSNFLCSVLPSLYQPQQHWTVDSVAEVLLEQVCLTICAETFVMLCPVDSIFADMRYDVCWYIVRCYAVESRAAAPAAAVGSCAGCRRQSCQCCGDVPTVPEILSGSGDVAASHAGVGVA